MASILCRYLTLPSKQMRVSPQMSQAVHEWRYTVPALSLSHNRRQATRPNVVVTRAPRQFWREMSRDDRAVRTRARTDPFRVIAHARLAPHVFDLPYDLYPPPASLSRSACNNCNARECHRSIRRVKTPTV